jgi:PPIC-type PPIASE domain
MTVVWHHEHHRHARHVAPNRGAVARLLVLATLVIVLLFGGGWFVWSGWRNGNLPRVFEAWFYVPIGTESGHLLWYPHIARLARGIAAADGRGEVTESDYAQAIDATVRRNALEDLAEELGVTLTDDAVQSSITWTDDIRAFQTLAGWSDDEYAEYVVRGFVLATTTEEALLKSDAYRDASIARMSDIQSKITLGIAFEDIAKEYSEDPVTAQSKGSFGYVLPDEVDAAFAPVFDLPMSTISDVITTLDAYWVLRTEDSVTDESGTRILLRGIAIKKASLADVLDAKVADISPMLWVR